MGESTYCTVHRKLSLDKLSILHRAGELEGLSNDLPSGFERY